MKSYSVQFKIGVTGIFSVVIWILAKFNLLRLNFNEWLTITGILITIVLFYHFYGSNKRTLIYLSIYLFFLFTAFYIFLFKVSELRVSTSFNNFYLELFIYSTIMMISSVAVIGSISLKNKLRHIFVFLVLMIFLIVMIGIESVSKSLLDNSFFIYLKDVRNYGITLLIVALFFFPIKNLISLINKQRKVENDNANV